MPKSMRNAKAQGLIAGIISVVMLGWPTMGGENRRSIPDFSGIWAHLTFPDVEPPLKGAGPVRNLSHVTTEAAQTLAPYNGAATSPSPNGVSNLSELVGDFTNPILKPDAAEVVKRHGEISKTGIPYPTPSNQCWPGGVPFVFWNISECKCFSRRTKSRSSMPMIMKSAMFA
jgi:hypothetical protein